MINSTALIIASFTSPMYIPMAPASLLWMFPLLAAVAIIYKATKLRVIFLKKFAKEVAILFATIAIFMVAAIIILNILVHVLTN